MTWRDGGRVVEQCQVLDRRQLVRFSYWSYLFAVPIEEVIVLVQEA